jgi:rfaE bifunctional protein kinase chain/domain
MSDRTLPSLQRISKCRVLVVGDIMLDRYWHGEVSRISAEAPVPIVHIRNEESRLGGAANVALNAATLGAHVTLMSMVGRDDAARQLRRLLADQNIETYLGEDPNMETVVKLRVISRSQQMLRIDFEREPDHEVLTAMVERFKVVVDEYDVVLFSDYGKGGLAHIPRMIKLARDAGKAVLIDPKGDDWERYRGATVITPNCAELAQVVGPWINEVQLLEKARALCSGLALRALLLTRSEDGMTLFEGQNVNSIPAQTREVADVTGAGDTVIATLGVMVACGLDLLPAITIANQAAGLVVSKFGTASLGYDELHESYVDRHRK